MRKILETCMTLDRYAWHLYQELATRSSDPGLATVFDQMAREEKVHIDWWSDLLTAWESGLIPDIAAEHDIVAQLDEIAHEIAAIDAEQLDAMTQDQTLDLAAHLEFYMLDPVFSELTDLMQPGGRVEAREAYSRHVMRLIEAIETYHSQEGLAAFLARVLRRAYRDQQRLSALATRDQLTGLYNRRGLMGHVGQWTSWSARYGRPMAVALIDVDRFKDINDTYGHGVGDAALQAVSRALEAAVRSSDLVGRFGGDEFLVLAPETARDDLAALMERVLDHVRSAQIRAADEWVSVSVSVGGAWLPGGVDVTVEHLVVLADRSLYAAKESGRNRAGEPLTPTTVAV